MSKLDDFLFCAKYCILQNSTVLSSNMAKVFFFKFQLKIPKQGILGLKFDFFFYFERNFAVGQIAGCWFQIWKYSLKLKPNEFSVPNFWIFIFAGNFVLTNSKVLISNMAIGFQNYSRKTPQQGFFGPKLENYLHCTKL